MQAHGVGRYHYFTYISPRYIFYLLVVISNKDAQGVLTRANELAAQWEQYREGQHV